MNINETKSLIKQLFKVQIETGVRYCVELESGPGIGKSECINQVGAELTHEWGEKVGVFTEFLSTREQPDVAGFALPARDADESHIMVRTRAPWMPRAGSPKYGIIFLDEFRQAAPEVQKPAAELLLNGRVGESSLPIEYLVVAASNRESDRSGVHQSLAFIENRRMLIKVSPDVDTWVDWAERNSIHPYAIAFAKAHPGEVFKDKVPDKSGPFATPRTLVRMSHLIDRLPTALLSEAAMGYMGEGAGAQFIAFMRVVDELPSYEEIVAKPDSTKVPTRPDANYAVMQMLAHRLVIKDVKAVFEYLKRLGREFQIAGLQSCLRRHRAIVQTPEFVNWAKDPEVIELVRAAQAMKVSR